MFRRRMRFLLVALLLVSATNVHAGTARKPSPPKREKAAEPTVTLDVKDEEVRAVLQSIKTQCGIRNLIVDPNVKGAATFVFHKVPCPMALSTVLATFGLAAVGDGRSVVSVEPRKR
jgi:type II secretory pathway component HofQ